MLNEYEIHDLGNGAIGTYHHEFGRQMWMLAKLTYKHKNDCCAQCGLPVGDVAFRPITNLGNRMMRICQRHPTKRAVGRSYTPCQS